MICFRPSPGFFSACSSLIFLIAVIALSSTSPVHAQTDTLKFGWNNSATGNLNLSQAYFDNWTKGGTNALSWESRLEGVALRKEADWNWESKGRALYGQSRLDDLGTRKAADELMVETIYTRNVSAWVNPFASARFQTQFAPGFEYDDSSSTRVSGVFDPAYLTQTVGLGKSWEDAYKVRLGGTLKQTFSAARYGYADDASTDGTIETFKLEPGATFTAEIRRGLMENILLTSVLDVFANFKGVDAVDLRWENQVTAKVNSFVSANFALDVLYDKDLSTKRQVRQTLSVGISFLSI
jgi:hypothetical protein